MDQEEYKQPEPKTSMRCIEWKSLWLLDKTEYAEMTNRKNARIVIGQNNLHINDNEVRTTSFSFLIFFFLDELRISGLAVIRWDLVRRFGYHAVVFENVRAAFASKWYLDDGREEREKYRVSQ